MRNPHPAFFSAAGTLLLALSCSACRGTLAEFNPSLQQPADLSEWVVDGSGAWSTADGKLVLHTAGVPGGPIRRPAALAVLSTRAFSRATIEAEVRSTASPEVRQRDLQIIVGYESPARFYYVHLAGITDAVHNGIFVVADADRRRIDSGTASPQLTDQGWHKVKLEWNGNAGTIVVWVDESAEPVLAATDTTIKRGRVGFGSFDDTGEFRNVRIVGRY
jgi:hypothetical protein